MALRCFLFTADEAAATAVGEALKLLNIEADHCPDSIVASERIANYSYQILVVDWDHQPDAAKLLKMARERKVSERPLCLAIVSDDASAPKALQAGANSILRKPISVNQAKDTLTTARDLLRARGAAAGNSLAAAAAAGATAASGIPVVAPSSVRNETSLRAGEFLSSSSSAPRTSFDVETDLPAADPASTYVRALQDLEPVASSVAPEQPAPTETALLQPGERRGLQWYLNRAGVAQGTPGTKSANAPAVPDRMEVLGYDQLSTLSESTQTEDDSATSKPEEPPQPQESFPKVACDYTEESPKPEPEPRSRLGKRAIIAAAVLAACAVTAAPQAPWHGRVRALWVRAGRPLQAWLNPQPVTPPPAPASHENFARAGDEYKLPVAEAIPDATTDPTQIRVTPMVDPTAKKPNGAADPGQATSDASPANSADATPITVTPVAAPADGSGATGNPATTTAAGVSTASRPDPFKPTTGRTAVQNDPLTADFSPRPAPAKTPAPRRVTTASASIPSSLKSQMASTVPDASGNKAPETALPSIEPVAVAEPAERALLTDQPAVAYPASAKGQQGSVVLQVLIGRDGSVQDAKFLQGSLAFARAAIDGVKLWKFKPYAMNGRPVSVQTNLTLSFKPGS